MHKSRYTHLPRITQLTKRSMRKLQIRVVARAMSKKLPNAVVVGMLKQELRRALPPEDGLEHLAAGRHEDDDQEDDQHRHYLGCTVAVTVVASWKECAGAARELADEGERKAAADGGGNTDARPRMRATGAVRLRTETPTKPPTPQPAVAGGFIIQHPLAGAGPERRSSPHQTSRHRPSASGARRRSCTRGSEVGDRYRPSLKP